MGKGIGLKSSNSILRSLFWSWDLEVGLGMCTIVLRKVLIEVSVGIWDWCMGSGSENMDYNCSRSSKWCHRYQILPMILNILNILPSVEELLEEGRPYYLFSHLKKLYSPSLIIKRWPDIAHPRTWYNFEENKAMYQASTKLLHFESYREHRRISTKLTRNALKWTYFHMTHLTILSDINPLLAMG